MRVVVCPLARTRLLLRQASLARLAAQMPATVTPCNPRRSTFFNHTRTFCPTNSLASGSTMPTSPKFERFWRA